VEFIATKKGKTIISPPIFVVVGSGIRNLRQKKNLDPKSGITMNIKPKKSTRKWSL
jgi:hypothetical protein